MTTLIQQATQPTTGPPYAGQRVQLDGPRTKVQPGNDPAKLVGVTVIVPVFNEEGAVAATLDGLLVHLEATKRPFEILAVDDGSTDQTASLLDTYASHACVRVLHNAQNRGYGWSLKRAVLQAKHDLIAITDADGTYPARRLADLIDAMADCDMVVGARTGDDVAIPLIRRPAKWLLTRLAVYLTGVSIPDLNSGLRVIRRTLVERFLPLLPDGFSFTTTITLASLTHQYNVRYVPISYTRRIGKSSIRPIQDTWNFVNLIVRTVLYFKPLKVFAPASALLMVTALAIAVGSKLWLAEVADVTSVTLVTASLQTLAIGLLADLIEKRSPRYG